MNTELQQPVRVSEAGLVTLPYYTDIVAQEKLDGVRAVYLPEEGGLYTRNGKRLVSCEHIADRLNALGCTAKLDGEVYIPGEPLNVIAGKARRKSMQSELQFHVFDIAGPGTFRERYNALCVYLGRYKDVLHPLVVPVGVLTPSERPLSIFLEEVVSRGGEGIIVRDGASEYLSGYAPLAALKVKPDYIAEMPDGDRWDKV